MDKLTLLAYTTVGCKLIFLVAMLIAITSVSKILGAVSLVAAVVHMVAMGMAEKEIYKQQQESVTKIFSELARAEGGGTC